jgi:hypothetical protein
MDWPPPLLPLLIGRLLPLLMNQIGMMMYIWPCIAWLHTLAPGSLNQSLIAHALSSIKCPNPQLCRFNKTPRRIDPCLWPSPSITVCIFPSLSSTSYAHPTSPDLPNQGYRVAPWFTILSDLCPTYTLLPILFPHWIYVHPLHFDYLTTHICLIKVLSPSLFHRSQYTL